MEVADDGEQPALKLWGSLGADLCLGGGLKEANGEPEDLGHNAALEELEEAGGQLGDLGPAGGKLDDLGHACGYTGGLGHIATLEELEEAGGELGDLGHVETLEELEDSR